MKEFEVLNIETSDKKYRVVVYNTGATKAFRNDEPWRDLVGDKLILQLAYDLDAARGELTALKSKVVDALNNL